MPNPGSVETGLARDLLACGFARCDDFLDADAVIALRGCADERNRRGEFRGAGIGAASQRQYRPELRGDAICWLQEPFATSEREVMQALERLRSEINARTFLGLWEIEAHYARYAPGCGYARHLDRPIGSHRRAVSFVIYLNPGWQSGDGGEFRRHKTEEVAEEIAPVGGRLICFLSAQCEHEVLPALQERASLAGWFLTRA